ncbi:MAG: TolC family protein [Muribaculaceae bacterium]|nr:TolC family protein [Muribaculaceae bacterium]
MKLKKLFISAVLVAAAATAGAQNVLPLSLDQCIRIALNDNPTVKVDSMEIERVDYARKETLGQLFPQISASGQYTRNLAIQTFYMDAGDGETRAIKMGRDNTYAAGFSATVPIVMPTLWRSIKLNDNQILQNLEKARATKLDLVNQVKNAYYALLLANDSKRVIEANHATAQNHAAIYQKQFELGTASEYDVLRANVAVTNLEPSILEAENTIKQLKLQLKLLMGMDVRQEIEPTETLEQYKSNMYGRYLATDTSLVKNTTLKTLDLQTDYLKKVVDVQRAAWIPTLSGSGNLMWNSMSMGNPLKDFQWTKSSAVGLTLSFPIFTGFQRINRIKQAQIQANEMRWQRENLERSLHVQVQSQMDNINKSIRQIESNEGGVRQAEKASDIMQKSFQIGAASFIQLRDTDDALMSARLSYYQAIYNYLVAESNLENVLGNTHYVN